MTLICLDEHSDNQEKNVVSLLNIALDDEVSAQEKLELLRENFEIRTTERLGREVSRMCNYSDGILQKGIEQGIVQGIQQGMERGLQQGMEQGKKQRDMEIARDMIKQGCTDELIRSVLKGLDEKTMKRLREEAQAH